MERLTKRCYGNYVILKELDRPFQDEKEKITRENDAIARAAHHLAAYEDSGLTPEEVMELAKIVRCKDCKYFDTESCPMEEVFEFWQTRENGFCNYGEMKES